MALPLSLAQVPAFVRPLKYSHTFTPSLSRGGRGVSGLVPAEKPLWVSVPSRYTWPISLTNENLLAFDLPLLFSLRSRLAGTSGKAGILVRRGGKKGEWDPGLVGNKGTANHEVEDNEKAWSQSEGESNASSPSMVSSVNTTPGAYGNTAAFKKAKETCFLCSQNRMSSSGVNLTFHTYESKENKKRMAKGINISSACFLKNQHASLSLLFICITASRNLYTADIMQHLSNQMCAWHCNIRRTEGFVFMFVFHINWRTFTLALKRRQ